MDISALRERNTKDVYSVSELNNFIKNLLDSDRTLSAISVSGEISNLTDHRSGHLYFSLKDSDAQIRAVMFRSQRMRLKFIPEDGMKVTVRGSVSLYPQGGSVQLYAISMEPDGTGALYKAYEQLKSKLYSEGLFDEAHKMPLPRYPKSIGVITSPTGAAVRDIINVTGRRFPLAKIYLYPSLVQGDGAEENLIRGVDYFDRSGLVDVVIIGRGGGSIEDLWAFNGERLARRIYDARVPIISAVGHETDFTICDFVSDLRAPTPSAAAELAVPDARDLILALDDVGERISLALRRMTERKRERLERILLNGLFTNPNVMTDSHRQKLSELQKSLKKGAEDALAARSSELRYVSGKIDALSPLSVLSRGYTVTQKGGAVVNSINSVNVLDDVKIIFRDGEATASIKAKNVKEITKESE